MKKAILLILALVLCACAKTGPAPEPPSREIEQARWDLLLTNPAQTPYRIQFSLRFGEEGNTRRVTGILWGNGEDNLRLDIMAGVGVVVAKIADTPEKFILYSPRDNKVYTHSGPDKPLLKIGMPLPFDLQMLAALLEGQYRDVFGSSFASARMDNGDSVIYSLDQGPKGELEVSPEGFPVSWKQDGKGWVMTIVPEENSRMPKSLKFSNPNGKRAIVLVKEREKCEPFNHEQMEIAIPAGAGELPLSKYHPS